jgi:hypothetical protein
MSAHLEDIGTVVLTPEERRLDDFDSPAAREARFRSFYGLPGERPLTEHDLEIALGVARGEEDGAARERLVAEVVQRLELMRSSGRLERLASDASDLCVLTAVAEFDRDWSEEQHRRAVALVGRIQTTLMLLAGQFVRVPL